MMQRRGFYLRMVTLSLSAATIATASMPVAASAADGGELSIGASFDASFARVYNPLVRYLPGSASDAEFIKQVELALDFGISNALGLGTGVRVALPMDTTARNVLYDAPPAANVLASSMGIQVPLRLTYQYSNITGMQWVAALEGGIDFAHWRITSLEDAKDSTKRLYSTPASQWSPGAYGRVSVGCQWRLFDILAVSVGPFFQKRFAGGWQVGGALQADLLLGIAPSLEN